jgi:hypothetical protein
MRLYWGVEVKVYSFSVSRLCGGRYNLHALTALPSKEESLIIEYCIQYNSQYTLFNTLMPPVASPVKVSV